MKILLARDRQQGNGDGGQIISVSRNPLDEDPDAPFDGPRLRRSRLHRGIEIEHIADITKINPTYLRFIEDERFDDLPAPVYVRGFVRAYASCVGLEAEQVAGSYMERFLASREIEQPRARRAR